MFNFNRIACLSVLLIVVALAVYIQPAQSQADWIVDVTINGPYFNPNTGYIDIWYTTNYPVDSPQIQVLSPTGGVAFTIECDNTQGTDKYTWNKNTGPIPPDGTYSVIYTAYRSGTPKSDSTYLTVDTVPPVTTYTPSGTGGPPTYTSPVTITLTAQDGGSGVQETYCCLDPETPAVYRTYTGPFPVSESGSHTIKYWSRDKAGNDEPVKSISFTIVSKDDPVTNITLTGTLGEGGVYVSPVRVELTATDSCSGVEKILCSLDDWNTTQTYILPFNVSAEGNTTVRCYAVDYAGNIGDEVSQKFTISTGNATVSPTVQPSPSPTPTPTPPPGDDTAPPVTVVTLNGKLGNGADFYTSDVQVILVANDGTGSGVNRTQYSLDNATWYKYVAPFTVDSEGMVTVYYYSVDNAYNVEATHSKTFAVSKQAQFKLPCLSTLAVPLLIVGVITLGAVRRRKGGR